MPWIPDLEVKYVLKGEEQKERKGEKKSLYSTSTADLPTDIVMRLQIKHSVGATFR